MSYRLTYLMADPNTLATTGPLSGILLGGSLDWDTTSDTLASGSLPWRATDWTPGNLVRVVATDTETDKAETLGTYLVTKADDSWEAGVPLGTLELHPLLYRLQVDITTAPWTIGTGAAVVEDVLAPILDGHGIPYDMGGGESGWRYASTVQYDTGTAYLTIFYDAMALAGLTPRLRADGGLTLAPSSTAGGTNTDAGHIYTAEGLDADIIGKISRQTTTLTRTTRVVVEYNKNDVQLSEYADAAGAYSGLIIAKKETIDGDNPPSRALLLEMAQGYVRDAAAVADTWTLDAKYAPGVHAGDGVGLVVGGKQHNGTVSKLSLKLGASLKSSLTVVETTAEEVA